MAKATQLVHWPGKSTMACDEHARQAQVVAHHIGLGRLAVNLLSTGSDVECTNCINEKKVEVGEA